MPFAPYPMMFPFIPYYPGTPIPMQPCYGMFPGGYPGQPYYQPQGAYAGYAGQPYGMPAGRKKTSAAAIVLIIIGVLVVIGGGVAAAILLTGGGPSSFNLGEISVTGEDITFKNLVLAQDGKTATLTGSYDNESKAEGDVYITVQGASDGGEQLLSFTIPVEPGSGKSFSRQKNITYALTSATVGSAVFQGTGSFDDYPLNGEDRTPTPSDEDLDRTTPVSPEDTDGSFPSDEEYFEEFFESSPRDAESTGAVL